MFHTACELFKVSVLKVNTGVHTLMNTRLENAGIVSWTSQLAVNLLTYCVHVLNKMEIYTVGKMCQPEEHYC